jgi:hypothetical protein
VATAFHLVDRYQQQNIEFMRRSAPGTDDSAGQFAAAVGILSFATPPASLGATLNPVREAIRKLEVEGLINVYAQKGIRCSTKCAKACSKSSPSNSRTLANCGLALRS